MDFLNNILKRLLVSITL